MSWVNNYIAFIVKRKYEIVIISWLLICVGGYIGYPAFFILDGAGFEPPGAESAVTQDKLNEVLMYPEYPLVFMVSDPTNTLNVIEKLVIQ